MAVSSENFFKRKLVNPLLGFLKQGVSPHKLALVVALGIAFGLFPVLGSTSLLCAAAALVFGLNMPAIQLVNYFMYPLQLLLYIPYFKMGAWIFNDNSLDIKLSQIFDGLKNQPWLTIQSLWWANVHAMLAWLITAGPTAFIIFFICKPVFESVAKKIERRKTLIQQG